MPDAAGTGPDATATMLETALPEAAAAAAGAGHDPPTFDTELADDGVAII